MLNSVFPRQLFFWVFILGFPTYTMAQKTDLPLIAKDAKGTDCMVFHITGDGGWRGFDKKLAREMNKAGYAYLFLDAFKYFWDTKTPDQMAADMIPVIREYAARWNKKEILLTGFSFGAEVIPFLYNRLPEDLKSLVKQVVIISPSSNSDFTIHISDMIGMDNTYSNDVVKEVEEIKQTKVLAVFGNKEHSSFPAGHIQPNFRMETVPGSHHFTDAVDVMKLIRENM